MVQNNAVFFCFKATFTPSCDCREDGLAREAVVAQAQGAAEQQHQQWWQVPREKRRRTAAGGWTVAPCRPVEGHGADRGGGPERASPLGGVRLKENCFHMPR